VIATYGSAMSSATAPSRTGYTFDGYYSAGNTKYYNADMTSARAYDIEDNATLYAKWVPNQYTVSFDKQGGDGTTNSITVTYGSTYGALPTPTKTGYTFAGWWTEPEGDGSEVISTTTVTITQTQTLHAKWNLATYDITYIGAVTSHSNPATYNIETATITLTAPAARNGYTWGGWYDNSGLTGSQVTSIQKGSSGNKTLYAKWNLITYDITYIGAVTPHSNPATYTIETPSITLVAPAALTGYTWDGWYDNSNFTGSQVTTIPKGSFLNKTLYAKWTANQYTVSFDKQGGDGAADSITVTYGSTYGALPTPTKTGHTFGGWWTAANGGGTEVISGTTVNITQAQTLYAKWTENTYAVTYLDGGGGAFSGEHTLGYPTTHTYGTATGLKGATKQGYLFGGWFVGSNCNGTALSSLSATDYTSNITLYAKWVTETIDLDEYELYIIDDDFMIYCLFDETIKFVVVSQSGGTYNLEVFIPGNGSDIYIVIYDTSADMDVIYDFYDEETITETIYLAAGVYYLFEIDTEYYDFALVFFLWIV